MSSLRARQRLSRIAPKTPSRSRLFKTMSLADLSRVFGTGLYWYSGQVQSGGEVLGLLKFGESLRDTMPPAKLGAIHASSRPSAPHWPVRVQSRHEDDFSSFSLREKSESETRITFLPQARNAACGNGPNLRAARAGSR